MRGDSPTHLSRVGHFVHLPTSASHGLSADERPFATASTSNSRAPRSQIAFSFDAGTGKFNSTLYGNYEEVKPKSARKP